MALSVALGITIAGHSATNTVTSLADSGNGSLRQAIADATPGDTIMFSVSGAIRLGSMLSLVNDISILGPGASVLTISGIGQYRLFGVSSNISALISGLTLRDGHAPNGANATSSTPAVAGGSGGAITNGGSLTLRDCAVLNNAAGTGGQGGDPPFGQPCCPTAGAAGGAGGAICSLGTLSLSNCTFIGNKAGDGGSAGAGGHLSPPGGTGGSGGAIYSVGTLWLETSTLSSNATGTAAYGGSGTSDAGSGGAVYSAGIMTASRTTFSGNSTGLGGNGRANQYSSDGGGNGGDGGGICGLGVVWLTDCSVSGNTCGSGGSGANAVITPGGGGGGRGGCGGGVYATSNLTLIACAISLNRTGLGGGGGLGGYGYGGSGGSGGSGGALYAAGSLFLTNCTLTGNCCTNGGAGGYSGTYPGPGGFGGSGGAIFCAYGVSNIAVNSCTVVSNAAGLGGNSSSGTPAANGSGAGICLSGPSRVGGFLNNIVALGIWRTQDVAGVFASLGHNLIGATNGSSGFTAAADLVGSAAAPLDPLVGPMADNGGPTATMALLPGSPAIDEGSGFGTPTTDQRGIARPMGAAVDIGAFEYISGVPALSINSFSVASLQLRGTGQPGQCCRLLGSVDLSIWSPIATNQFAADGTMLFQDNWNPTAGRHFYRLVTP